MGVISNALSHKGVELISAQFNTLEPWQMMGVHPPLPPWCPQGLTAHGWGVSDTETSPGGWWARGTQRKETNPDNLLKQALNRLARFILPKGCILGPGPTNHLPQNSGIMQRFGGWIFVYTFGFGWDRHNRHPPGFTHHLAQKGFLKCPNLWLRKFCDKFSASLAPEQWGWQIFTSTCTVFQQSYLLWGILPYSLFIWTRVPLQSSDQSRKTST